MKSFLKKSWLILFMLSLNSCIDIQPVTISGVREIKVSSVSVKGIEGELKVTIHNPNYIGFSIYESHFDVAVNGIPVGVATINKGIHVPSHSEKEHTFYIKSDFSKLSLADLPAIFSLINSKSVTVSIKGELTSGNFFYKKGFPIDLTQTIPLDK